MWILNRSVNMKLITTTLIFIMMHLNRPVLAKEQDGLLQLEAQSLRLDKLQRATIHLSWTRVLLCKGTPCVVMEDIHATIHYTLQDSVRCLFIFTHLLCACNKPQQWQTSCAQRPSKMIMSKEGLKDAIPRSTFVNTRPMVMTDKNTKSQSIPIKSSLAWF